MQNYELLYIISNKYTEAELDTVRAKVNGLLTKYGAVIGFTDFMGRRKLAYPIDHEAHGYYILTEFEIEDGTVLQSLTNDLRLDKEVVRAQMIAKPKITKDEIERFKRRQEAETKAANAEPEDETSDKRDRRHPRPTTGRENQSAPKAHSEAAPKAETAEEPEATEVAAPKVEKADQKPAKNLDEKLDELLQNDVEL
ncbi:MAG: 30S ribosomal protein S6 [Candidatus Buchananbacteria bacterium]|nr:30S ribosomal protein S6 [Candidatus Buchananbacteria bacterium]